MSSIFLSHNSADKPFVRKLAKDLQNAGYYVWVDEAEIKLGDSLIEKIREGIDKVMYVGVILSKNSIEAPWVKKEVDIAMNQEISGKQVKVLPMLLENIELPGFLIGKLYADFTTKQAYKKGLKLIKERLDSPVSNKSIYSQTEMEYVSKKLKEMEDMLNVSNQEKALLLERLSIERANLPQSLIEQIESEKGFFPNLDDINRNYSFVSGGINITAGYVLHGIQKELRKGGGHVLATYCSINGQEKELALLISSIYRRLNSSLK
ncbi:toll/interleukin-1 receptor domain-containing protein [Lysinibacillus sphaericus]|uniref:toll/interleukin-1 receptor domain-containing protein n=1 Tax=Lysinibacillus sphaericus TaxID=1421 RepID=UPI0021621734|nr:toll/interleukin-1 receptor domain-containing protein [Lysinibacillus sphaericus]MCS1383528.1 toll/interleukin-1 receptor domain-containing protein [Lysinibacillus sphaericus]